MFRFDPFPALATENLNLRKMQPSDAADLFEMRSDPRMHEYTDTLPDRSMDETTAYIAKMLDGVAKNQWIIWTIEHKASNKVIGSVSIWNIDAETMCAELGYGIAPEYQGRGFMKEALLEAAEYGLASMKLKRLDAYTEETNICSLKLLEKCGFIETGKADDQGYVHDRVYHMTIYSLFG